MSYHLTISTAEGPTLFYFGAPEAALIAVPDGLKSDFELLSIDDDLKRGLSIVDLRRAARLERMERTGLASLFGSQALTAEARTR